jgi:LmbE family N-acetylglucosaminyl deacetylase
MMPTLPFSPLPAGKYQVVDADTLKGCGTSLQAWKASKRLAEVAPIDCAQLVPADKRAVIIAPHPDDEVLGSGGLLQLLGQEQRAQMLISVTNGSSYHQDASHWNARRQGIIRSQESAEALSRLGLPLNTLKWVHGGFPDAEVEHHEAELESFLLSYLQPSDIVFTTWRADGHSDHEAVARATLQACLRIGAQCYEMPIWAWHWAEPEDPRIPWERARKVLLDHNAQARKRHAIQAFASQLYAAPGSTQGPKLTTAMLQRFQQPFELFFL